MKTALILAVAVAGMAAIPVPARAQEGLPERGTPIANEGKIGDKWMLAEGATLATPQYPAHLAPRGDDTCLALGYLINADGTTSNFVVMQQWTSAGDKEPVEGYWKAFAEAGADALSQWRFKARPDVAVVRPTYTVATFSFNSGQADPVVLRGHCAISNLSTSIAERKSGRYANSRERRDLERFNRAAAANRVVPNRIQAAKDPNHGP